jgi:lipopolysaccharide transport system ATP-binding protein
MTLLTVDGLGKAFSTYDRDWHRIARWFGMPFKPAEQNWVLRNINFSVEPGQTVGIAGPNGAGKSTLLKLITGTMHPTEGRVQGKGRIAAILELGLGFNPNLTGRQNATFSASLLGLQAEQIMERMPEIEDFAEIGTFFDEPIRTYSSGMQMRVAFAVVTAVRPDLLIVDEALSVGDTYFQHKCMSRIREFQQAGTSLLMVSHDSGAIQGLCNRAILLDHGKIVQDGDPESVMDFYNAMIAQKEAQTVAQLRHETGKIQTVSGSGAATVEDIKLCNEHGEPIEHAATGQLVMLQVRVKIHKKLDSLVFGYGIKDRLGQVIFGTNTWHTGQTIHGAAEGEVYSISVTFPASLGIGSYSVQTALCDRDTHHENNYEWRDLALVFSVSNPAEKFFTGSCWLPPEIEISRLD